MTEIPEDVMRAANECVAQFRWNNDNLWHLFVARAIMEARDKALEDAAVASANCPIAELVSTSAGPDNHKATFAVGASAQKRSIISVIRAMKSKVLE